MSQDMAAVGRALASQAFAKASPGVAAASRVEDCAHLSSSDVLREKRFALEGLEAGTGSATAG